MLWKRRCVVRARVCSRPSVRPPTYGRWTVWSGSQRPLVAALVPITESPVHWAMLSIFLPTTGRCSWFRKVLPSSGCAGCAWETNDWYSYQEATSAYRVPTAGWRVVFGKASRSFRADLRSSRHFPKTNATSSWRAHFGCAIWSSASSIAVVTMASSDVQEVDASKGIYAVCGQLWSGKKMA